MTRSLQCDDRRRNSGGAAGRRMMLQHRGCGDDRRAPGRCRDALGGEQAAGADKDGGDMVFGHGAADEAQRRGAAGPVRPCRKTAPAGGCRRRASRRANRFPNPHGAGPVLRTMGSAGRKTGAIQPAAAVRSSTARRGKDEIEADTALHGHDQRRGNQHDQRGKGEHCRVEVELQGLEDLDGQGHEATG